MWADLNGPIRWLEGFVTIGSILGAIVIGAIIGILGRLIVPGRQNIPWWLTIIVGIVAAFIGSWIARLFGVQQTTGLFDWWEIIFQVVVAAILVYLVAMLWSRRGAARS